MIQHLIHRLPLLWSSSQKQLDSQHWRVRKGCLIWFWDRAILYCSGWAGMHYADPPTSASPVLALRLRACTTTPSHFYIKLLFFNFIFETASVHTALAVLELTMENWLALPLWGSICLWLLNLRVWPPHLALCVFRCQLRNCCGGEEFKVGWLDRAFCCS